MKRERIEYEVTERCGPESVPVCVIGIEVDVRKELHLLFPPRDAVVKTVKSRFLSDVSPASVDYSRIQRLLHFDVCDAIIEHSNISSLFHSIP